jgi:hypothetical protein
MQKMTKCSRNLVRNRTDQDKMCVCVCVCVCVYLRGIKCAAAGESFEFTESSRVYMSFYRLIVEPISSKLASRSTRLHPY